MSKKIPVADLAVIAMRHNLKQTILVAWDGASTHVVTYGSDGEQCAQAAIGGNKVKEALGWPESLKMQAPIVVKLQKRITELENMLLRLAEKTRRANGIQRSGGRLTKEDWGELYDLTNEALGLKEK